MSERKKESNWRTLLQSQYDDISDTKVSNMMLDQLQLNEEEITANIDKLLKKKTIYPSVVDQTAYKLKESNETEKQTDILENWDIPISDANSNSKGRSASSSRINSRRKTTSFIMKESPAAVSPRSLESDALETPSLSELPKTSTDTQLKFFKAKVKTLEKQVDDLNNLKKNFNETIGDLQKQLKVEKEETKQLKKRFDKCLKFLFFN